MMSEKAPVLKCTWHFMSGLIILLCMAILVTACDSNKNSEGLPIAEYNFFNAEELAGLWGQPKKQITNALSIEQDAKGFTIAKTPKLMHLQSSMIYGFDYYDKLDNIMYVFFDRSDSFGQYEKSYDTIHDRLEAIYGQPVTDRINWKVDAQTQNAYRQRLGEAIAKEMATAQAEWHLEKNRITLVMLHEKNLPFYAGVTIQVTFQQVKE